MTGTRKFRTADSGAVACSEVVLCLSKNSNSSAGKTSPTGCKAPGTSWQNSALASGMRGGTSLMVVWVHTHGRSRTQTKKNTMHFGNQMRVADQETHKTPHCLLLTWSARRTCPASQPRGQLSVIMRLRPATKRYLNQSQTCSTVSKARPLS